MFKKDNNDPNSIQETKTPNENNAYQENLVVVSNGDNVTKILIPTTSRNRQNLARAKQTSIKKSDDDFGLDDSDNVATVIDFNEKFNNNNKLEPCHTSTSSLVMNSTIQQPQTNHSCQDKSTNTTSTSCKISSIKGSNEIQLNSSTDSDDFNGWDVADFNISPSNISNKANISTDSTLPVNHSFFSHVPTAIVPEKCSQHPSQQESSSIICHESSTSIIHNCASMPNNMNFFKQYLKTLEMHYNNKNNNRVFESNNSNRLGNNCNIINSLASSSNICRAAYHHHHHNHPIRSLGSLLEQHIAQNNQIMKNNKKENNLEMISSIQATKIISNHSNSENTNANSNYLSSAAITTLTSSSSGLPVTALTVLESPKLSNNRSHNWQAYMPTLKDRMATIFNRDILADIYFLVGKKTKTRFAAHKFVLSIGSAVFDAMFNGLLAKTIHSKIKKDSSDDIIPEVELPDIEPEAFQALLRFLYMDEIDIGPETVMATLYVAKKYEVLALEAACVNFLKANLNPENAFMLLTQARLFDETNLADLCLDVIDKHTLNALQSEYFLDVDIDTLKIVLGRDTLRVREASLFTAVLKWTESECIRRDLEINGKNKRQVLADALYLLRFPLMTIEEFALYAAQSGLLTDKEVVNLFLYYTVDSKCSIPFSFEPRCCITGEEYSVSRFQRTESRWGYSGTSDRIRFLTDRPIFVIGFGLYGSIQGQSEYEVIIEIIHTGSGKVLASNTTAFTSDGSDSTFKVMFQYPVEISQNTNYTACATLKGIDSYYGTNGCRTLTVNLGKSHNNKDSVTFQFSYAAGCNNGTSVEDGQIPEIIFYV